MAAMPEALLKVRLSPAEGQFGGTFTEGMPVAEAIGYLFAFQIDTKDGERLRAFGRVVGVRDRLLNIDNVQSPSEQVVSTTIYLQESEPLTIIWRQTAVAIAEVAVQSEETER